MSGVSSAIEPDISDESATSPERPASVDALATSHGPRDVAKPSTLVRLAHQRTPAVPRPDVGTTPYHRVRDHVTESGSSSCGSTYLAVEHCDWRVAFGGPA